MADTSPVVATNAPAPATTEPTNELPIHAKADRLGFIAGVALILILCLSLITIIAGRWTHSSKNVAGTWNEVGLWSSCECSDAWTINNGCSKYKSLLRTVEAFSIIAVVLELFVVLILWRDPRNERRTLSWVAAFIALIATFSLIITWAVYAASYDKTYCGHKVRDLTRLNWAFGVRVGESALWLILNIMLFLQAAGKMRRNRIFFFFAFVILALGIITTTSRGWIRERPQITAGTVANIEGGAWEVCSCIKADDVTCSSRRNLLRASEAFAIISIAVGSLLLIVLAGWIPATPGYVSIVLALITWFAQLIVWICIAAFYSKELCGSKFKHAGRNIKLHWAFGVQVALSGLMIPVLIITIIRARRHKKY